jgi:photosystem II stability/assembly factor-like uncharacterized protein
MAFALKTRLRRTGALAARICRATLAAAVVLAGLPLTAPAPALAGTSLPGSLTIDYSSGYSSTTPSRLRSSDVGIVIRYVGARKWKSLTRREANALRAAGIDIAAVYETKAGWMLAGRSAGVSAAKTARRAVRACGGPNQPFVWFACDVATKDYSRVNACLAGAASVLGADHVGIYGSYSVCENALKSGYATKAWQTEAWSNGKVLPQAAIFQPAHRSFGNLRLDYDSNFMRSEDVGQWGYVKPGTTWGFGTTPATATLTGVRFTGAGVGVAVGEGGTLIRTTNGGAGWDPVSSPTSASLAGVAFASDSAGVAVGASGTLLRTGDAGASWSPVDAGTSAGLSAVEFAPGGSGLGVAVGDGGTVVRTTDSGSWSLRSTPTSATLRGVTFFDAEDGWAVGDGGTVLRTTDGGESWSGHWASTSARLNAVRFVSGSTGWAVGDGGTILRTVDGGWHWIALPSGTKANLNGVYFADTLHGWAVGSGRTVLRTVDGGISWVRQDSLPTLAGMRAITSLDGDTMWMVGESGTILSASGVGGSPWGSVAGTVGDASSGKLLGGMSVTLNGRVQCPTATDGSYAIARMKPGSYDLKFSNWRYITGNVNGLAVSADARSQASVRLTPKTVTGVTTPLVSLPATMGLPISVASTISPAEAATSATTRLALWHWESKTVKKKVRGKKRKVKVWYWRAVGANRMTVGEGGALTLTQTFARGRWHVQVQYPGAWNYLPSKSGVVGFTAP